MENTDDISLFVYLSLGIFITLFVLPISIISPLYITIILSEKYFTTEISWLISIIVIFSFDLRSFKRSKICDCIVTSKAEVGSSQINI